jgi:hypothetical protein
MTGEPQANVFLFWFVPGMLNPDGCFRVGFVRSTGLKGVIVKPYSVEELSVLLRDVISFGR